MTPVEIEELCVGFQMKAGTLNEIKELNLGMRSCSSGSSSHGRERGVMVCWWSRERERERLEMSFKLLWVYCTPQSFFVLVVC